MSLVIRKGVPTRMSTSRLSTMRASRASCFSARDKKRRVSPARAKGVTPSAYNACWKDCLMGAPIERAMDDLIILVYAPMSRVSRSG